MEPSVSATQSLLDELKGHVGRRYGVVRAWDAVNEPMIRHWCEALDFDFPAYTDAVAAAATVHRGIVAPATMLPVWLMPGIRNRRPAGSDLSNNREIMGVLERAGYVGILGTDCEQDYERPLRPGERISCTFMTESISAEKQTRFGPGFFVTFLQEFHDEREQRVGTMRLRILRFRPSPPQTQVPTPVPLLPQMSLPPLTPPPEAARPAARSKPSPPQPVLSQDTAFFWNGLQAGKLLIQRCASCHALRHPPGPACMRCHSLEWDSVESRGRGTLASFVVMHKPVTAGFDFPHPVGLVELDEGVRLVVPLVEPPPRGFEIGMAVEAVIEAVAGEHRLPSFKPAKPATGG